MQQGSRTQSQGFELALTPAVFGLIGYGIDRLLGTLVDIAMGYVIVTLLGGDGLVFILPWL